MSAPPVVFKSMSFEAAPARTPPAEREVLVRRVVAGAVDLAVGLGLMVLVAAAVGTLETAHGFSLPPVLSGVAAVLLYAFLVVRRRS